MGHAATVLGEVNEEVPLSYTKVATSRPPRSSPGPQQGQRTPGMSRASRSPTSSYSEGAPALPKPGSIHSLGVTSECVLVVSM
ncbi:hypothetical protein E2C01_056233 [Portunus trituberculatus]|uniref:Uncharacterized protein n=1 Tax=Portunus trituberculatus TaxID=210409 RepID=A0A5B7GPV1_PORTR|nr:hypothetical protein [Portunus trituberculatus]